jgi:hypothetical protein
MTDQEANNLISAQFAEWKQTHGPLFDLGVDAAHAGDHATFDLVQLLLKALPENEDD